VGLKAPYTSSSKEAQATIPAPHTKYRRKKIRKILAKLIKIIILTKTLSEI